MCARLHLLPQGSRGVLALVEGHVGDALEQLGVVPEVADVAPADLVGRDTEVIVAERLDSSKHGVDLGLLGNKGSQRIVFRLAALQPGPGAHLRHSVDQLAGAHERSARQRRQVERRSESDAYCLTERRIYGWPQ